jgi:hypothetical protein
MGLGTRWGALYEALRERKCHNCDFEEKEERRKKRGS